ncbi:MAG: tetratricopeptide repeat protein [Desulfobulbaceae bacterium]|nr:MAG: tetratricopeptide repeat protein [Desulfobulbaceae bacterium]
MRNFLSRESTNYLPVYLLVSILLYLCYSNTFNVPWQFDDRPNITENAAIHIDNLNPSTLWQTLFSKPFHPGTMERPVAFFSFALNWYFGKDNIFGYHVVNFFIHLLTTLVLFETTKLLLQLNYSKIDHRNDIFFVALLSAILWSINPIQTQAVTYIVQRMASLAAMFYICAVLFYIKSRKTENIFNILINSFFCLLFFALALGCKENSITFLPSILLIELLFFNSNDNRYSKYYFKIHVIINFLLFSFALLFIYNNYLSHSFSLPFDDRPFSLKERLLSQPQILIFYISLLFYPSPMRLSLEHSITLASSVITPWATFASILCISGLLILGLWQFRKRPLISFAIFFYFINHLVESTIIPLEPIFEHRNYLPSFFLFLPIASVLNLWLNDYGTSSRLIRGTLYIFIPVLLILLGVGTYTRNAVWRTEESLWQDSMQKAPDNGRPYARLAEIYGWQKERTPENLNLALALLRKSLTKQLHLTSFKAAILGNIGKIYASSGKLDEAIHYYEKSLHVKPNFLNSQIDLVQALMLKKEFKLALEVIDKIISNNNDQSRFYDIKGVIHLWLNQPQEGANSFQKAVSKENEYKYKYFSNLGLALSRSGFLERGKWFLMLAYKHYPNDIKLSFFLIEHNILSMDKQALKKNTTNLFERYSLLFIAKSLLYSQQNYLVAPMKTELISPAIYQSAQENFASLQ